MRDRTALLAPVVDCDDRALSGLRHPKKRVQQGADIGLLVGVHARGHHGRDHVQDDQLDVVLLDHAAQDADVVGERRDPDLFELRALDEQLPDVGQVGPGGDQPGHRVNLPVVLVHDHQDLQLARHIAVHLAVGRLGGEPRIQRGLADTAHAGNDRQGSQWEQVMPQLLRLLDARLAAPLNAVRRVEVRIVKGLQLLAESLIQPIGQLLAPGLPGGLQGLVRLRAAEPGVERRLPELLFGGVAQHAGRRGHVHRRVQHLVAGAGFRVAHPVTQLLDGEPGPTAEHRVRPRDIQCLGRDGEHRVGAQVLASTKPDWPSR